MLKIVSALNGSSVCQSLTILGIELQLQLKKYYFSTQKKIKYFFVFLEKMIFGWFLLAIFRVRQPMEDDLQNNFFSKNLKKNIFFCFLEKNKKNIFLVENFFLVIFRGRRPMEDDLTNNLTSLHFPDACVSSIQLLLLLF